MKKNALNKSKRTVLFLKIEIPNSNNNNNFNLKTITNIFSVYYPGLSSEISQIEC